MLTLGSTPYSSIDNNDLENFLLTGNRLRLPVCVINTCPALVHLIQRIWSFDPHDRPNFKEIINYLDEILQNEDLTIILNSEFFELNSAQTDSGFEKTPLLYST